MSQSTVSILVVDDEFSVRDSLTSWFKKDGYEVLAVESAAAALRALEARKYAVGVFDIKMPGIDGIELQERVHHLDPQMPVIMLTAFASVETAVRALKQGAFDYVTKPIDPDELSHLVRRALEQQRLRDENRQLRSTIDELTGADEAIVGDSPAMQRLQQLIRSVAKTEATVLIRGESGTGKELVARAIHAQSARRYFPLIPVNCGSLPEDLLESELFGHEKGAFTGARQRRKGRLEMADGGTLFLDEVGTIPRKMQVDLLRVLETHEFTRVGASRPSRSDFRVVCATNDDLRRAVAEGRFREDFLYRIDVFPIEVPPLRDRREDIPLLVRHFVDQFAMRMQKPVTEIAPEVMVMLQALDWPGNVRELSNTIERAMVVCRPPVLRGEDLALLRHAGGVAPAEPPRDSLAAVERRHVAAMLERTGWNITRAAELLEVDRVTVYNKIKKYGLAQK
ncbi:MAG: sigma-54-dependent Fis family transcriptional regulator [Planctomycetes bacterium]|nr:sigma-54-dependent Fis family transcriptional regulator [Planctomycetota bacterium]